MEDMQHSEEWVVWKTGKKKFKTGKKTLKGVTGVCVRIWKTPGALEYLRKEEHALSRAKTELQKGGKKERNHFWMNT